MRVQPRPTFRRGCSITNCTGCRANGCGATLVSGRQRARKAIWAICRVFDEQGGLVAEMKDVQLKQARREMLARLSQGRHSDWFYEVVWEVKPLSTIGRAFWLPPPAKVSDRIRPSLTLLSTQHGLQAYDELAPRMDAVSAGFVIQALRRMGWAFAPGRRVSLAGLAAGLKVITAHRRLLERMLGILEERGPVEKVWRR